MHTTPSVRGEDVAAVTVPSSEKTGFSFDIDSKLVSLIQPSFSIIPFLVWIGQISSSKLPISLAELDLTCESRANSSWESLEMFQASATFSAVTPILMYASGNSSSNRG